MTEEAVLMTPEDRNDLIIIATHQLNQSNQLNLTEAFIEKDLWVTFMLKVIFELSEYSDLFKFKGGTSLSKGFNVINRFSEDIDLILNSDALGYSQSNIYSNRSKNQQNKLNETLDHLTEKWIQDTYIPHLREITQDYGISNLQFSQDDNDKQTIIVSYPHNHENRYMLTDIRLEIGTLAARTPSKHVNITSYLSYASGMESQILLPNANVDTVAPYRTFWEKATILHSVASSNKVPPRYSRHYYDLYQMAHNNSIKQIAFENYSLLADVVTFKEKFYPSKKSHYESATLTEIKLVPSDKLIPLLEKDFSEMQDMMLMEPPSFDQIINYLNELEQEIHDIF